MTVDASLEAPRPVEGDGFSDAVTVAFGDPRAEVYGLARVGLAGEQGSGLAVLFSGREVVAVRAEGAVAVNERSWEAVDAAGVRTRVDEPLRRWHSTFEAPEGGFTLELEALGAPGELAGGGMQAYEALCRVRGTALIGDHEVAIDCLGQRGHSWGAPDWEHMSLARTVSAWMGEDLAVLLSAIRPAKAKEHDGEQLDAVVLRGEGDGGGEDDPDAITIEEPRLSTTYDDEGRQRRAGFELWEHEEARAARRGAGEVLCGTSLDLGRLRLDCAFFAWHMEGRTGIGRYDILRRT